MSILSTNQRLISIGESYSAGNGIDITDQIISVTGDATPYSAGDNIDIQDHIISGKDWSQDITDASANAYNETTAWVQENYANSADMSYISGVVDNKLDTTAWSTVSGNLATEDYVIMADNINYTQMSSFVINQHYASESNLNSAFDYLNDNKLDTSAFNLPNSANWNESTNVVETNSAAWFDNVGDAEVNNFVYTNSATINDVDTSYIQNSGTFLTAHQVIPSAKWEDASDTVQSNSAQWSENTGDVNVNNYVYNNSAINDAVNGLVSSNSASWNGKLNKLDFDTYSADINGYIATLYDNDSYFSGAIDYLSGNAGKTYTGISPIVVNNTTNEISADSQDITFGEGLDFTNGVLTVTAGGGGTTYTGDAQGALDEVYTNSGVWLTAHQSISADEWNSVYDTVEANSGSWTGDYVPLSASACAIGDSNEVDNTPSFAQGNSNSAIQGISFAQGQYNLVYQGGGFAQGAGNSASNGGSFAQGYNNSASVNSFAQGAGNSAYNDSLAQGYFNSANTLAFAQGMCNSAYCLSIAQGNNNYASGYSQAFGLNNKITNSGMAIGTYNKTSSDVSFVIGNGSANSARSDSFIIYHDGSVSAAGKISANGVELGAGGGGTSLTGDAQGAVDEVYTNSAHWNDNYSTVTANSASWGGTPLPMSAGEGIDIQIENDTLVISATGGAGNPEVESYVQTNSASIDDVVSTYETNSGTYLTAHQPISANEWNSNYDTVITNSGVWGGSALLISAGPGIKLDMVNNTLVASTDETVLWSGTYQNTATGSIVLSESWKNFQKIEVYGFNTEGNVPIAGIYYTAPFSGKSLMEVVVGTQGFATWGNPATFNVSVSIPCRFTSETAVDIGSAKYVGNWNGTWQAANNLNGRTYISKVVGINRINSI